MAAPPLSLSKPTLEMGSNLPFDVLSATSPPSAVQLEPFYEPTFNLSIGSQSTNPNPYFPDPGDVLAEFNQISDLFRTAFDKHPILAAPNLNPTLDPKSAIVRMPEYTSLTRRQKLRSAELVRVTDIALADEAYFREIVRRTRMVYDSLRIFANYEEDKRRNSGQGKQSRSDLRAASIMKDRGMWMNRDKRIVGSIPGVKIGDLFLFRMELCVVGLHGHAQAGINYFPISQSSTGEPIAMSIIVSGRYEDDVDAGNEIVYTGHGVKTSSGDNVPIKSSKGGIWHWNGVCDTISRRMVFPLQTKERRQPHVPGRVSAKYFGLKKQS